MRVVTFSGLRGGTGTTSVVAAVGYALQALGNRVLLIDLNPTNLLRLHGNLPFDATAGWARADLAGADWQDEAFHLLGKLHLLPYGLIAAENHDEILARQHADKHYWRTRLATLQGRVDWVLFDVPPGHPCESALGEQALRIKVLEADAAAHALLMQKLGDDACLLVNRFDPQSALQRDLMLLWREHMSRRLVPQVIHRDESMAAALAHKSPVGHFAPDALASQDVATIATWCMARQEPRP